MGGDMWLVCSTRAHFLVAVRECWVYKKQRYAGLVRQGFHSLIDSSARGWHSGEDRMEDPPDLDDLLTLYEREIEEDSARLDVMPPPLPLPVESVRILDLSAKDMLFEVARKLPALDPVFQTWYRYGGYFSHIYVYVPDLVDPVKLHEVFCSCGWEHRTPEEAEEKAARSMIRTLEKEFSFETKDLNWEDKRRFHIASFNSCTGWRAAQEEITELKWKVEALSRGWRRMLGNLEQLSEMCVPVMPSPGVASVEEALPNIFYEGVVEFKQCGEKYEDA